MKISPEDTKPRRDAEEVSSIVVNCGYKLPLGLLINFGSPTFKYGCKRIVNAPQSFVSS